MGRIAALALCLALAACSGGREGFAPARSDDGPGFAWNHRPSLESSLEAGMPYGQFRQELLSRGWTPVADAGCRANLLGLGSNDACVTSSEMCRVCEDLPELSLYAPDGVALVLFRHEDGHELQASVVGELGDRHRLDTGSRFTLVAWEIGDGH